MTIDLVTPPWPVEPGPEATVRARLAWCAEVARWAPSKHNTQPWRFVVHAESLEVWADPSRRLETTDASGRELVISCGTAIEFATVAARAIGYELHADLFPDGDGHLVARLVERGPRPATTADRVRLAAVSRRRTDRGPLDGASLPPALPFTLQSTAAAYDVFGDAAASGALKVVLTRS